MRGCYLKSGGFTPPYGGLYNILFARMLRECCEATVPAKFKLQPTETVRFVTRCVVAGHADWPPCMSFVAIPSSLGGVRSRCLTASLMLCLSGHKTIDRTMTDATTLALTIAGTL